MEIYADSLSSAIDSKPGITLSKFRPSSPLERYSHSRIVMRYLRYWHYPSLIINNKADIHHVLDHGYGHLLPKLKTGKTCCTVHDLIPMLNWKGLIDQGENASRSRRPWLNLKSLSYLADFDALVTISSKTKADLIEHLDIAEEKIEVIPPVISRLYKLSDIHSVAAFARKYQLDTDFKWIMVSGREFYKNHASCLRVLKELVAKNDSPIMLIKTGLPSESFDRQVANLGLESSVRTLFLEDISELALLYSMVDCLLFPSLYEGFGMPVAEALACGTPVVTSDRGSLPEVGGGLALQCDPLDINAMVAAVESAIYEPNAARLVREQGAQWLSQFRPDVVGDKMRSFYNRLAER